MVGSKLRTTCPTLAPDGRLRTPKEEDNQKRWGHLTQMEGVKFIKDWGQSCPRWKELSSEFSPAKITDLCTPASANKTNEQQREAAKGWNWHTGVSTININKTTEEPVPAKCPTRRPADRNLNCSGLLFFSTSSDRQQQANKWDATNAAARQIDQSTYQQKYTHSIYSHNRKFK